MNEKPPQTAPNYLTIADAARSPIVPGRPSTNAVWRWMRRGIKARTGERIRLRHVRVGGKLFTTEKWVGEFVHALAEADLAAFDDRADAPRQPQQRHRKQAHSESRERLRAAGLV